MIIKDKRVVFIFAFILLGLSLVNACVCEDGICEGDESCLTCPEDCGECAPLSVCGNNILEGEEECDNGILNGFLCWAEYGT
jgi:hypothetical protein